MNAYCLPCTVLEVDRAAKQIEILYILIGDQRENNYNTSISEVVNCMKKSKSQSGEGIGCNFKWSGQESDLRNYIYGKTEEKQGTNVCVGEPSKQKSI